MSSSLKDLFFASNARTAVSMSALVALVLAVFAGGYLLTEDSSYDFALNQKISASSPLRLTFPEQMEHASVEKELTVPQDLVVDKEWSDNTLVLKPKTKLTTDTTYVIRISAHALKADGLPLGRELTYTFQVTGAPVVSAQVPLIDSKDIQPNSDIVIVFDRPVVAMTQTQGGTSGDKFKNWPVKISPSIQGTWRWLGTTTAAFQPEKPLTLATKYTVSVPAGIKTVSGDATEKDFTWSLETERPRVQSVLPSDGSRNAGPTTVLEVSFSQEMDLISAKSMIQVRELQNDEPIRTGTGAASIGKAIPVLSAVYGTVEENGKKMTDKKTVVIKTSPLSFNKKYALIVNAGIRGLKGDLGSAEAFSSSFYSVGEFNVKDSSFRDGILKIDFSSPVDNAVLKKMLVIKPAVDLKEIEFNTYEVFYPDSAFRLETWLPFAPSTEYTVTLSKDAKDQYGQPLKKPFEMKFTTPALTPDAFLYPRGGRFSIFEKGKTPTYYLNQVNVSDMHVTLGEIDTVKLREMSLGGLGNLDAHFDVKSFAKNTREWHVKPTSKKNAWASTAFDIEKYAGKLKPGLYAITYDAPEWKTYNGTQAQDSRIFVLTNLGVTLKYSGNKALVWVTDLQTGEAVSGAAVNVYAVRNDKVITGKTDAAGFFETPLSLADFKNYDYDSQPVFFVTVEKGGDYSFVGSDWNPGFQPYDFDGVYTDFRSPDRAKYRLQSTLYSERPLYGAGDTVHFKGIVRFLDWNGAYSVPDAASRSVAISIMDPESKEVYSKTLKLSEFGSFNDSFTLAKEASLGSYWVTGKVLPEGDTEGQIYGNFAVLAYRKPEYKATVNMEKEDYFTGDKVTATINGQYYFGAPMAGASVRWRTYSTDYYFNKYTEGWYSFGLDGNWCWYSCVSNSDVLAEGEGTLDAAGRLPISFPADISKKSVSQTLSVEADLTDQNNQVVSTRAYATVHKSNVYVGIRSDDYAVASGEKMTMKLVTVAPDGSAVKNVPVELKIYSRKWNVTKQKGVDGEYYYDNQPEDTYLRSVQARTGDDGKGTSVLTLDGTGEFRVVASAKDEGGRESQAGWTVYLWGDTYFNWPRSNNDRVSVVADKPSYKVGDTAKILVKSPYQGKGVKALVTIERENVMMKKVVDVTSNALPIDIAITEDMVPTAYMSVVIIKPRMGETFDDNGTDTGAPAFKVGYVRLPIDTSSKEVHVSIRTDKERYAPGEKVSVKLEAVDAAGNPVQSELSLGVVDMSLLDLAGFSVPNLVSEFYRERGLGVVTANMLTFLMERFKPGSKGGGGGDDRTRGNFLDTAYWNPRIVTDKNGQATASFTLPDNLTTWQLLAIGSTKDNKFGSIAKTVIETKKVILRPVRPRFAVNGDKITLGAIVHNYLETPQTFTVTLAGKGFTANGGQMEQKVTLAKDAQTKLSFPIRVSETATGITMRFTASAEGGKDALVESIPVFRFGVQQTVATSGTTDTQVTEQVVVPTKKDAPDGEVAVSLSPSAAVYLKDGLEYLATYPYGCAEQTMSAVIPNVSLKTLQGFEQFKFVDDATLQRNISVGFQKMYSFQRADGGFGYFENSLRSYPYLTAYILYGFKLAERAGYSVDRSVMSNAVLYLQNAVRSSDQQYVLDGASQAFVLYVLSEYDSTDSALLNALYKKRVDLPLYAKSHLAMALKKAKMDAKALDVMKELESVARIDTRGAHFEEASNRYYYEAMNTDARTTALVLQAMLRVDPKNVLVPKIVRGMLSARHDGAWDTTQSTAQSVLSLVEFLKVTKELEFNYAAAVEVNGKNVLDAKFTDGKLLTRDIEMALSELPRGQTIDVKVGKQGTGNLYYDVVMSYFYTPDNIEPAEEGIGILREVMPLTKADVSIKVGTTQKVRLTITVPETRHFVAVESMLPAGFEPIDLQYATSQQELLQNAANSTNGWYDYYKNQTWRFGHIEYRDDRVFLFAEELPAGVYRYEYLERATTPGTFRERPAKVWEMYYPENYGQTSGGWITIGE